VFIKRASSVVTFSFSYLIHVQNVVSVVNAKDGIGGVPVDGVDPNGDDRWQHQREESQPRD
jgi:hypothetical protein